jgi:cellulose synthase (UDP-forming)
MPEVAADDRPEPPVRVTNAVVFSSWDRAVFAVLSVFGFAALIAFFSTWFGYGWGRHPFIYVVLTGVAIAILVNQQGRWFLLLPMRRPRRIPVDHDLRVAVVTTFVPGAESAEMIEASLQAMIAIDYPHDTWLLDEGGDATIEEMCQRLDVRHFTRKHRAEYHGPDGKFRSGSKHGNYNAWLYEIGFREYDYLIAFDPDHMPAPSYIAETLGYFRDPTIGYVQAAQAYYNQGAGLVARGAAEETYAYFSAIQMASYGLDYPIIVGGHNAHRMAALSAVGGFAVHDADDLLLTLTYRAAGWGGVYVPVILARGLTPVDWRGYLVQQRRWARSVIDLKLHARSPHAAALPLNSRIMSTLHGLNFLHRSLANCAIVCVALFLLATGQTLGRFSADLIARILALLAVLWLQEVYRQRFYLDWRTETGIHWRAALLEFAKWPWFLMALLDVLAGRRHEYTVTRKTAGAGTYWPFVVWNASLATVLVIAWRIGLRHGRAGPLVVATGAVIAAISIVLVVNALRTPPPPYAARLWNRNAWRSHAAAPTAGAAS